MKHAAWLKVVLFGMILGATGCSSERSADEVCEHAWRDYGSKDGARSHDEYMTSCLKSYPDGGYNAFEPEACIQIASDEVDEVIDCDLD